MPLSAQSEAALQAAKGRFLSEYGNTPANAAAFDSFIVVIRNNPSIANTLNDQIQSGHIRSIGVGFVDEA